MFCTYQKINKMNSKLCVKDKRVIIFRLPSPAMLFRLNEKSVHRYPCTPLYSICRVIWFIPSRLCSLLSEQQQTERHHRHTGYEPVNGVVVLAVLPGGGEQLVQRDEDHDAGDRGEHYPEEGVVEERG